MSPKNRYLTIPNLLTSVRLCGAVSLIPIRPLSRAFYIVYSLCGVTDGLDGFLARRTGTVSAFGSRLDSAADLAFYSIMMIRVFPELWRVLPRNIWLLVGLILAMRVFLYAREALVHRRFASPHTVLNKITGLMMFGLPYLIALPFFPWYALTLCAVALTAVGFDIFASCRPEREKE